MIEMHEIDEPALSDDDLCAPLKAALQGKSILLLEDDPAFFEPMLETLRSFGFSHIDHYLTGEQAREAALSKRYDALLLDRINPGMDGLDVLRALRSTPPSSANSAASPILIVTSQSDDQNPLRGLLAGADDYVPKPINELELVARVAAQIRRSALAAGGPQIEQDRLVTGPVSLSRREQTLTFDGRPIKIQAKPFAVLAELMACPGQPLTQTMLFDRCWPEWSFRPDVWQTNLYATIRRLQDALEPVDSALPEGYSPFVVTLRGRGYMVRDLSGVRTAE